MSTIKQIQKKVKNIPQIISVQCTAKEVEVILLEIALFVKWTILKTKKNKKMKNTILILLLSLFITPLSAQTTVKLRINHKMQNNAFAINTTTQNSAGDTFNFKRVEYYLSNFAIIHDSGKETAAQDVYHLVNATNTVDLELGSYNLTTIEMIRFSIGVDKDKNHLDPANYPKEHALAPKTPLMHWGWTSGYRFAALEGKSGSNLSNQWELHALFDENYFTVWLPVTATMESGELIITINADYSKALSEIDMQTVSILHGENKDDLTMLKNFRDSVFSNSMGVLSTNELEKTTIDVFPNPSKTGLFTFSKELYKEVDKISITNTMGQEILVQDIGIGFSDITLLENGMYFLTFYKNGKMVQNQKLVVSL